MTPLVLLHGYTGAPSSWDEVREHLGPRRPPTLCPALLGHGEAPDGGEAEASCWEEAIDRLAAWLRSRLDGPAHLVGYSLGARVAAGLLARHPSLFCRAALIGLHPGLADEAARAERRAADARWAALLRRDGVPAFVEAWERQDLFATQASLPPPRLARQRATRLGHRAEGLARALEVLGLGGMPDLRPALAGLALPLRLVVGARDPRFVALAESALSAAASSGRAQPRVERVLVEGAGHNLPLEAPEALARLLAPPPETDRP